LRTRTAFLRVIWTAAALYAGAAEAQLLPLERLPSTLLEVAPPEVRVSGEPGRMKVEQSACTDRDIDVLRSRIVNIAVQEWAFFGFHVVDQTDPPPPRRPGPYRRRPWMDPAESARVAASIAGYWSVTPDGGWIIDRQNSFWRGPLGVGERWRDPWSAAFVSWTMCEAGIAESAAFRRSINHRTYIDQAIRARDGVAADTAYVAYDVGERVIEPGDLLCSARRHGYRNLDDRRRHLGEGARTHCDIVVHIDAEQDRILAIGGNVRGRVSLKLLHAQHSDNDPSMHRAVGLGDRTVFAHLRLSEAATDDAGLLYAPSIQSLATDTARRKALEASLEMELPATTVASSKAQTLEERS
jgi:hypothetical protein